MYNPMTTFLYLAEAAVLKICPAQFFSSSFNVEKSHHRLKGTLALTVSERKAASPVAQGYLLEAVFQKYVDHLHRVEVIYKLNAPSPPTPHTE